MLDMVRVPLFLILLPVWLAFDMVDTLLWNAREQRRRTSFGRDAR